MEVVLITGVVVMVCVAMVACLCMGLCAKKFRRRRLRNAITRDVTCAQLAPLISGCPVDTLIDTRGRPSCRSLDDRLPFIAIAAAEGNEKMLRSLAEQGADLGFIDSKTNQNLLHMTISSGVTRAILWCLENLPGEIPRETPRNAQKGGAAAVAGTANMTSGRFCPDGFPTNRSPHLDWRAKYRYVGKDARQKPLLFSGSEDIAMTPLQHLIVIQGWPILQKGYFEFMQDTGMRGPNSSFFIFDTLINAGCDVSKTDSSYWTTLHYVTQFLRHDARTAALIIKSTPLHPVLSYRIPEHELNMEHYPNLSPLGVLITQLCDPRYCCLPIIRVLLEAGYDFRKDDDVMQYVSRLENELPPWSDNPKWKLLYENELNLQDVDVCNRLLVSELHAVQPLKKQCRRVIRSSIKDGGVHLRWKLRTLGLPVPLVSFLRLDDVLDEKSLESCERTSS